MREIDARLAKFNDLYNEAEMCDKEVFAEARSSILLVSGDHYSKVASKIWTGLRGRTDVTPEQKIRLTKNHMQRISKIYKNNILSAAPNVRVFPANETELQDRKSAELRQAVWEHAKRRHRLKDKIRDYVSDFNDIGEVFVKVFFDETKGDLVGYQQKLDEDGNPVFLNALGQETLDEFDPFTGIQHEMAPDDTLPVFSGDFVFERVFGFNVLRHPESQDISESPYLIIRKMVDTKDLKLRYKDDPEKFERIVSDQDKTYIVFDAQSGQFGRSRNQTLVREIYYRPCIEYPRGYYMICTENVILDEGELPGGIFPIALAVNEKIQGSCRGRTPNRHARPFQAEINRASSKIAEHQITLGDDKVVIVNGGEMSQTATFPGIRGYKITGEAPKVIPGRDGSQFLPYVSAQISEMYQVMGIDEKLLDKSGDLDAYQLIFRSASQKKVFSESVERFEQFLIDLCDIFLRLAQLYYTDDMLIPAIGRSEYINIEEFRNMEELGYQIKIEPVSEDIETQLGKQLVLSQAMQYGGGVLTREDFGRLLNNMPFMSNKAIFADMTLNERTADNVILALDRGEQVPVNFYDPHPYMIQRLLSRKRESDFKLLPPQVQMLYDMQIQEHEQAEALKQAQLLAAKSEYIPTGGAMVACDMYVQDPKNPLSQKRVRVPYESLNWLVRQIELQGNSLEQLENLDASSQTRIIQQAAAQVPPGLGGTQPPAGQPFQPPPQQPIV